MEEKVDEFHWNLKRLIREGYPGGIPLHNLSSVYGHWIKQPVEPKSILRNCESWEDVFTGNSSLRNSFVVVRRDQVPHVKIHPGPETSIDELTNVLELASYANYKLLVQTRNKTGTELASVIEQQQHSPDSTSLNNNLSRATGGPAPSTSISNVAQVVPLAAIQYNVEIQANKAELLDNNLETESFGSPNPIDSIGSPSTIVTTNAEDQDALAVPVPKGPIEKVRGQTQILMIELCSDDSDDGKLGDRVADNSAIPVPEPNVVIKPGKVDTDENVGNEENSPPPDNPPSHSITVNMKPIDFGSASPEAVDESVSVGNLVILPVNPINPENENLNTPDPDPGLHEVESPMDLSTSETQEEPVAGPSRRMSSRPKIPTKRFQIDMQLVCKRPRTSTDQLPPNLKKPNFIGTRRRSEVEEPPAASPNLNSMVQSENNLALVTNTPTPPVSTPNVESSRDRSMHGILSEENVEAALTVLFGPSMSDEAFATIAEEIANKLPPIERRLVKKNFDTNLLHPNEWIAVPVALPERQDTIDKDSHRRTLFKGGPITMFLFDEKRWMPADEDIELPKNTIVYGEFVEQLHSGRVTFDVIDCAIILGRDIRRLCLQKRRENFIIYTSSVLNYEGDPHRVNIRLKDIYQAVNMSHWIFDRLSRFDRIETREEIRCLPDPVEKREHNAVGGIVFMRTSFKNEPTDFTFAMGGRILWWFDSELALTKENLLYDEKEGGDQVCLFHFLDRIKRPNPNATSRGIP